LRWVDGRLEAIEEGSAWLSSATKKNWTDRRVALRNHLSDVDYGHLLWSFHRGDESKMEDVQMLEWNAKNNCLKEEGRDEKAEQDPN
jgi:hypothetical protein